MFKEAGAAPPAGMFTWSHLGLVLFFGTLAIIFFVLTRNFTKDRLLKIFKIYALVLVALEIFKIAWNIYHYGFSSATLNTFVPLYYCSLFLYAFVAISFGKGRVAQSSYAWLIYGGLISGTAFLIYPSSSLLSYPFYHFLSLHSILFHTSLVLVTVLILYHKFYTPSKRDFIPFIVFSLVFMVAALILNKTFGTNMMFLETPIAISIFTWLKDQSTVGFEIFMFISQLFLPFIFTHWIFLALSKFTRIKIYKPLSTNRDNT